MEVVRGIHNLSRTPPHPVVTIGNFDGVHLGHQSIINLAILKARQRGGAAIAYTFRPHPRAALRPEAEVELLTTYDEKLELLSSLGLDYVIEEPFSREFSSIGPEQFFNQVVVSQLNAEAVVVGYDFGFGKERSGHLEVLSALSGKAGIELAVVSPQRTDGEVVSSSRIRQYLKAGEIEQAARLLGREFFYRGTVIRGDGRGRKIGFPTANVRPESKFILPYGVYATHAVIDGRTLPSVTNLGVRPTFQAAGRELPALVETHVLDEEIDLYGATIEVRFLKRLRDERRFAGIDELKAQITADVVAARGALGA